MRLELGELRATLAKLALSANNNLSDNSAGSKLIQQADVVCLLARRDLLLIVI
jgi:hypothetical protein